jgi:hypothetical protein
LESQRISFSSRVATTSRGNVFALDSNEAPHAKRAGKAPGKTIIGAMQLFASSVFLEAGVPNSILQGVYLLFFSLDNPLEVVRSQRLFVDAFFCLTTLLCKLMQETNGIRRVLTEDNIIKYIRAKSERPEELWMLIPDIKAA